MEKTFERRVNRFALTIVTIIDLFLFFGYIGDYQHGNISFGFMLTVDLAVIASMIACYLVYFYKKDSAVFKHVSVAGYIVVYALAVLGAQNDLVFIMAFPLTIIYILYFDFKLILRIAVVFGAINLMDVGYTAAVLGHMHSGAPLNSTSMLLQGASTVVYMIVLCGTTQISNDNNTKKISSIDREREKSNALLNEVLDVAAFVKRDSAKAAEHIRQLSQYVDSTVAELGGIAQGNANNAESIEKQTVMTGNIQTMILETKQMSDEMLAMAEHSEDAVRDGKHTVDSLQEQAGKTKKANEQVVASVSSLIMNARAVEDINASIESARAGEAGRGFAVVSAEIRALADETRNLTERIHDIVEDLKRNADMAKTTVDNVIMAADTEHDLIINANAQFGEIGSRMKGLHTNVQEIYKKIEEILESNNVIVDSINHISAVSEEVTAGTQQAAELGADTSTKAEQARGLMMGLLDTVKAIDKYL